MSTKPIAITIRSKKLGVLIQDARLTRYKTPTDCATALGVTVRRYKAYELGDKSPSLPEVELLAYYLNMPLEHFWGKIAISEAPEDAHPVDPQKLVDLRQRMIGVMIRKTRLEAHMTLKALASSAGISSRRLDTYELGEKPIPLPELEVLVSALNISLREYQDKNSPVGEWFVNQRAIQDFMQLPPELQSFVCKPVNRPYLELAQRLSEMSVEKLRSVAEGLLEITL